MNKKFIRRIALFLSVAMVITSVNITNSIKEVEASDEYVESFEQSVDGTTIISRKYGDKTYNVMTAHLKALSEVAHNWTNTVAIGVSETTEWGNYAFQICYGTNPNENLIKLNQDKGYGNFDGVEIAQEQWYNNEKLEKVFAEDGIDIKVVRLDTRAYLLIGLGDGYELVGTMYIPNTSETIFTINNAGTPMKVSNVSIASGKENAIAALSDMNMKLTTAAQYFPIDSETWTIEGKITANTSAMSPTEDSRFAVVGASTWENTVAVMREKTSWKGQAITTWKTETISDELGELVASSGLWVRWTREGNVLTLYVSADSKTWTRVVDHSGLISDAMGVYISSASDGFCTMMTDTRISSKCEHPDLELSADSIAEISTLYPVGNNFNVMTAHLKALSEVAHNWTNTVAIGVSETTEWGNYAFQICYGTNPNENLIKLNQDKGYGNFDGVEIAQEQWYNNEKLEKVFAEDGIDIKVVRLDTRAYLLIGLGDGYELVGTMYIPNTSETIFTINNAGTPMKVSNVSIASGKENAIAALSDMNMKLTTAAQYFPIDSETWTIEGKITANTSAMSPTEDSRFAVVGASTWENTVAVMREKTSWKGQAITTWKTETISDELGELVASSGLWVRWTREGNVLTLYVSADSKTWTRVVDHLGLISDAMGVYISSASDEFGSMMTDMRISSKCEHPIIQGATVSLKGDIGLNFYMDLYEDMLEDEKTYVRFTLPGENHTETKVMVADGKQETISDVEYRVFSCGIAAKEMSSDVTIEVVRGNGEIVEQKTFCVADYANTILTDETNYTDADRAMVKALLNYGSYAQQYFGYKTSELANAEMQEVDKVVSMPTLDASVNYIKEGTVEGLSYYGTSLMLVTKTSIRHYFELSEGNIDDYAFFYNDTALIPVKKGTYYYVEITDIAAGQLDEMHSLSVTKGTESMALTYGAYTYIKKVTENNSYNIGIRNLMASLYTYNVAAEDYFTNSQQ